MGKKKQRPKLKPRLFKRLLWKGSIVPVWQVFGILYVPR